MQQVLENVNTLETEISKLTAKVSSLEGDKDVLNGLILKKGQDLEVVQQRELLQSKELSMALTGLQGKEKEVAALRLDETKRASEMDALQKALAAVTEKGNVQKETFMKEITSLTKSLMAMKGVAPQGQKVAAVGVGGGAGGPGGAGGGGLEEEGEEG